MSLYIIEHNLMNRYDKHDRYTDNRYCDNVLIENGKEYKLEKLWRSNKSNNTKDSKGSSFPYPKENSNYWPDKQNILDRLDGLETYLKTKIKSSHYDHPYDCLICGERDVTTRRYVLRDMVWEDGLSHYINVHNIEPSIQFKQFILNKDITKKITGLYRSKYVDTNLGIGIPTRKDQMLAKKQEIVLSRVIKNNKEYVMIERNQLLILDALMIHGGYTKRYIDTKEAFSRYSEHAGFLDFEQNLLSKIIVSGKTNRVDEGDEEIYLPMGMDDMFNYEYIFHTHPPTPKPGGRASDGILYEFPSIGDIYHFIDHHNDGNVIGSLVVAAEGLYNIRTSSSLTNHVKIDEDLLYKRYQIFFNKVQKEAIIEHGSKFTTDEFYKTIAQDASYINKMNTMLNDFGIHIDYYPRKQDVEGRWIIDTVFLVFKENKNTKKS